jgi:hypothetical protein
LRQTATDGIDLQRLRRTATLIWHPAQSLLHSFGTQQVEMSVCPKFAIGSLVVSSPRDFQGISVPDDQRPTRSYDVVCKITAGSV